MRKALAQNPNLLRTLMGLSVTLVFVLSYAVYGATIDTEYYVYSTERNESAAELTLLDKDVSQDDDGNEWTTWLWQADVNRTNLTWINSSLSSAPTDSVLKVINTAGWYSHKLLGEETDLSFNCAVECEKNFKEARAQHAAVAPKYASKEECIADFGADKCEKAPYRTSSGGSVFMPLMMGYMMGSFIGGRRSMTSQPLYRSAKSPNTFRTADNRSAGSSTGRTRVAKSATSRPSFKNTIRSRGGFGSSGRRFGSAAT